MLCGHSRRRRLPSQASNVILGQRGSSDPIVRQKENGNGLEVGFALRQKATVAVTLRPVDPVIVPPEEILITRECGPATEDALQFLVFVSLHVAQNHQAT